MVNQQQRLRQGAASYEQHHVRSYWINLLQRPYGKNELLSTHWPPHSLHSVPCHVNVQCTQQTHILLHYILLWAPEINQLFYAGILACSRFVVCQFMINAALQHTNSFGGLRGNGFQLILGKRHPGQITSQSQGWQIEKDYHLTGNLKSPINLTCLSLDCE